MNDTIYSVILDFLNKLTGTDIYGINGYIAYIFCIALFLVIIKVFFRLFSLGNSKR